MINPDAQYTSVRDLLLAHALQGVLSNTSYAETAARMENPAKYMAGIAIESVNALVELENELDPPIYKT